MKRPCLCESHAVYTGMSQQNKVTYLVAFKCETCAAVWNEEMTPAMAHTTAGFILVKTLCKDCGLVTCKNTKSEWVLP